MRAQKCDVKKCFAAIVIAVVFTVNSSGESGKTIFYASFDKGVNADKSAGLGPGVFNAKRNAPDFNQALASQEDPLLKLAPGLKGKGLLTGVDGQVVYYKADGNINPSSWTVTFWVKGLKGKNYLGGENHQELFEMFGGGGWTRFYKYLNRGNLMFLVTKKGPNKKKIGQRLYLRNKMEVNKWNFFALTYEKGSGVGLYLNGKLAARDAGMEPIQKPAWFRVGQSFGGD
ncbi:MAG: LamG domain-containing protein, partial [bacterium]|nr:LamG domain-containing protein [bacterium]